ncbi:Ada metal-binding domain-containing protein [Streptomyces sp. NPDC059627]
MTPARPVAGEPERAYTLLGPDGQPHRSPIPGALGGHRRGRLYGRLDCPSALRAIARGHYVGNRVFFADETTAIAAGYRPCAVCLPAEYARWRANRESTTTS